MQQGQEPAGDGTDGVRADVAAWAASGAMALTGWPEAPPLGPPAGLVPGVRALEATLLAHAGRSLAIDAVALLGERAAVAGLRRQGRVSCGGATRLVPAADGWLAVSLARPDDVDLLPAWLGIDPPADPWAAVAGGVATRPREALVTAGAELGLPVAALGEPGPSRDPAGGGVTRRPVPGGPAPATGAAGLVVVDLSALWAGPLCASLLIGLGATVVKVESTARPDGARFGPPAFYDLLNAGKRSVALDLSTGAGRAALHRLVEGADVVVEASRPRALRALGLDAERLLATATPRVWVSITGHGRTGPGEHRVAFGDDAAVAGGLVAWDDRGEPVFCADAVADPVTGLAAAAAVVEVLAEGGRWLLDASMAGVAAGLGGPTRPVPADVVAAPPRARSARARAAALGADTAAVLAAMPRGRP